MSEIEPTDIWRAANPMIETFGDDNEELLIPLLAGTRLGMELDRVPLCCDDHVSIKQLAEDFPRYIYLSRLTGSDVPMEAIQGSRNSCRAAFSSGNVPRCFTRIAVAADL